MTEGIALITGANRGIGLEVVRRLARRGGTVVLGSRDPSKGEAAAREIEGEARGVLARSLDVTEQSSIDALAEELEDVYGRIDVLVNNAAIHYDTCLLYTSPSPRDRTRSRMPSSA